jgi:hypothetical protein
MFNFNKIGEWRRLRNDEHCDMYSLPNIIGMVKSIMRWTELVVRIWERRGAQKVLMGET